MRFSVANLVDAGEMLLALLVGMTVREFARAWTATRLGDPTPRLWGRVTLRPGPWFEPFGSGLLPGLIAILWAAGYALVPVAYAKPPPIDAGRLPRQPRDSVIVSLAGPAANLALALVAGLWLRAGLSSGELGAALLVFAFTNSALVVFHLLPVPGLDGARIVALLLPPNVREPYANFDRYLPLMVLVLVFLLGGLTLGIIEGLAGAICEAATGVSCRAGLLGS